MKAEVVIWDWKEAPPFKEMSRFLRHNTVRSITPVVTGQDSHAVVLSDKVLTQAQAQKIYNKWERYLAV